MFVLALTVNGLAAVILLLPVSVPPFKVRLPMPTGPFVILPVLLTPKFNVPPFKLVTPL